MRPALAACALIAGCTAPPITRAAVPDGVRWAAVLELSENGALVASSGLVRWEPGAGLPVLGDPEARTVVVGFGELGAGLVPVASAPLRAASGCDPSLPAPAWVAELAEGGLADGGPAIPPLTADWLARACPDLDPRAILVDFTCASASCAPAVSRGEGCGIAVDLSACGMGRVAGRITPAGGACLDFSSAPLTCDAAPGAHGSLAAYACGGSCRIDLYPAPAAPPFEARAAKLLGDVATYVPADLRRGGWLLPQEVFSGYLFDLALLPDRAIVARGLGEVSTFCPARSDPESRLDFLDLETMAVTRTASAPPCLAAIDADPRGGGFFGVFGDASRRWMIGRFDAGGRLTKKALLDARDPAAIGPEQPRHAAYDRFQPIALRVISGKVAVVLSLARTDEPGGALVLTFSADTLQISGGGDERSGRLWAAEGDGSAAIYVGDDAPPGVHVFDVAPFGSRTTLPLPQRTLSERVAVAGVLALGRQVWAASPLEQPVVLRAGGTSDARVTFPFGRSFLPTRLAAWPGAGGLLLVAGTSQVEGGAYEAAVSLFDPERPSFLPGTFTVGAGTVGRIQKDRVGRLWLLLPWSSEVVRLTPR